jgi:undecaprenyl-diphosphatase
MMQRLLEIDMNLSNKIRLPKKAKLTRFIAAFLAHSGDSWFWLAGLLIIWLFNQGTLHTIAAFYGLAILVLAGIVLGIKFIVRRRRPAGEWGAIYRNTDPHSFPSGHAARAILLAVLSWALGLQPLAWILTLWVPLVSLARVSMGVHYLIDVIAGWLLGFLMSIVMLIAQPLLYSFFPTIFLA